jgi:uncharacterized protein (DUF1800 family)
MTTEPHAAAALALHRFGMGPRAGSIAAIASDPRGALLAELERAGGGRVADSGLLTSAQASRAVFEFRQEQQARAKVAAERKRVAESQRMDDATEQALDMPPEMEPPPSAQTEPTRPLPQQILLAETKARLDAAFDAELGFVERLVWFWSNHFCISADKIPSMTGAYEREAIRPHVLGRFADMLLAAEGHPAMLFYLDNSASIGPKSVAGINRSRGLNENLAREILELHTLGVNGGYSQADVTRFAYILTGWTFTGTGLPDHGGEFTFIKRMHEPGPQQILDRSYPDTGVEQGRAVLGDLARHPATATHIATKLARHFVADTPPLALIDTLAKTFRDTDGDLKAVTTALVTAPESWVETRSKLKRPSEWIMSIRRATGLRGDPGRVARSQGQLGEPLWRPSAPQGFSDAQGAWIDGLAQRLDIANTYAQRVEDRVDPQMVLDTALGPLASAETRRAVAQAESRVQALALLIMAPEFQRR